MRNRKVIIGLITVSLIIVVVVFMFINRPINPTTNDTLIPNEKLGISITPFGIVPESWYRMTYQTALETAKEGRFKTLWFPILWEWIEQSPGVYKFDITDKMILPAHDEGFDVGARVIFILTGNDPEGNFASVLQIPEHVNKNISSQEFRTSFVNFYRAFAEHYKGKVRYISIANSINDYFEHYPERWEGFKIVYPEIVDAIHNIDSNITVMSDLNYGESFYSDKGKMQKYLDYFGSSNDDAFGFIFYFIDPVYYGDFPLNFTKETLNKVLDEMDQRTGDKKVYIIETAMFSKHPHTGEDWTELQSDYVEMLLTTAPQKDFIIGVSWFTLYDAKDLPDVSWDIKAGLGLFDTNGNPKKAWETWKEYARF